MTKYSYVVTAKKSARVYDSVAGNFTGSDVVNLILGLDKRLEIYVYVNGSLKYVTEYLIKGKIRVLRLFRPRGESKDLLFIVTSEKEYFVLEWDSLRSQILIRSKQVFLDSIRIRQKEPKKQFGIIDPDCRLIVLHLFLGYLEVIPLDETGQLEEATYQAIRHHQVLDIKFLFGCMDPTVAVLYRVPEHVAKCENDYHVVTYEFSSDEEGIGVDVGPWSIELINKASLLIPVPSPLNGILIIGPKSVHYYSASVSKVFESVDATVSVYGQLNGDNLKYLIGDKNGFGYLLGDKNGFLHLIAVTEEEGEFTGLNVASVGETSVATAISSLGNEVVHVGAFYGNSQLIKLSPVSDGNGLCVNTLENYLNFGPMNDFCVVESDRQGKGSIAICSKYKKKGSFHVWSYGFGIKKQASERLEGITGMWALGLVRADILLVVSFISETWILELNTEGELKGTEIKGFSSNVQTLFCHKAVYDQLLQVTSSSVRLVNSTSRELLDEWKTSHNSIIVATANLKQVLLAGHNFLVYLEIGDGVLNEMKYETTGYDVSCLDITPIGEDSDCSTVAAVGMWTDTCVGIFSLPNLQLLTKEPLGGVSHSVLLCELEGITYLLCTLRDGHLLYFLLNQNSGRLTDRTKVSLGCQPISLCTFSANSIPYIFAASNTPTVIYSRNKKLLYGSVVDLKEVCHVCPFNTADFPDSLAFVDECELSIGTMDYPKYFIRSIPLQEEAVRVCHQDYSSSYALCCKKYIKSSGEHIGTILLLNDQTFEIKSNYSLDRFEYGTSVVSCSFADDNDVYYCIGTCYMNEHWDIIDKGRILVLSAKEGKLQVIAEEQISMYAGPLHAFQGKLLVLTSDKIMLYSWVRHADGGYQLKFECQNSRGSTNHSVETRGNVIVVGGLDETLTLLSYKPEKPAIEELYCHREKWSSAVAILDDDLYLGSDFGCNIFTICNNNEGAGKTKGEVVGKYHLRERVARFCCGSLLTGMSDTTCIFGTGSGSIGIVTSISPDQYRFLYELQFILREAIKSVGGLSHQKWISYISAEDEKVEDAKNFIDGDLIESFLNLSSSAMETVSKAMTVPVEVLKERVKDLTKFR